MILVLGSGYKYRLSLAERWDCTETIINQLLEDSYQNPLSGQEVTVKLHLVTGCKAIPPTDPHVCGKTIFHETNPGAKIVEHC